MVACDFNIEKRGKKKKNDHADKSLWKKEYEEELNEAMLSVRKRENVTRTAQSAALSDNEFVVEKLIETITSSEKYLKKVDSIDFRLNRLDIEVHEKTNAILKKLSDVSKSLREQSTAEKTGAMLDGIKKDIANIQFLLENNVRKADIGNRLI